MESETVEGGRGRAAHSSPVGSWSRLNSDSEGAGWAVNSCVAGAMYQEDGEHRRALFLEPCISQQGCPRLQWLALLLSALRSILEALKLQAPSRGRTWSITRRCLPSRAHSPPRSTTTAPL